MPPTHTPDDRKVTETAIGMLMQPDDQFLLAQRPEGRPYADRWEFPGDKLEAGGSAGAALTHEPKGELDVALHTCTPWHIVEHDYAHAYVRLYSCRVTAWDGTLRALEDQGLAQRTLPISVDPVLPAALPIFEQMREEMMAG